MQSILDREEKAGNFVRAMHAKGLGSRPIAAQLEKQFGIKLSHMAVKNWIDGQSVFDSRIIEENKKLKKKREKEINDLINDLVKLKNIMWTWINKLEKQEEYDTKLFDKMIKVLDTMNKILGNLQTSVNVKNQINMVDMSIKINKLLPKIFKELEDQGIIVIKKKLPF